MSATYRYCGLRLASAVALPALLPWPGAERTPDITVALGAVPEILPGLAYHAPFLQLGGNHDARVAIPAVASFRIEQGCRITVAPTPGGESAAIPLFLLRAAAPLLWLQRELFAMRASTVEIDGRVVALAGGSGVGKSTLTAALLQAGHRLLSDDLSIIDPATDRPMVLPTSPLLHLWRDSLDALDLSPGAAVRADPAMQKFEHLAETAFDPQPRPLAIVCHVEPLQRARPATERLLGGAAVQAVRSQAARLNAAQQMGLEAAIFLQASRIARVPQLVVRRPLAFAGLRDFARALPALLEANMGATQ